VLVTSTVDKLYITFLSKKTNYILHEKRIIKFMLYTYIMILDTYMVLNKRLNCTATMHSTAIVV